MKSTLLQNLAVALAAAGGAVWATQDPAAPARSWPPDPDTQLVNVQGQDSFSKRSRDRVIYSVPERAWFVLTDFRTEPVDANDPELDVVLQLPNKKEIVVLHNKIGSTFNFGGGVGIKFPPKSRVVLHRNNELSSDLSSLYMLTGYLVPVAEEAEKEKKR